MLGRVAIMRILQVVHSFPPYNTAGTEVYSYTLAKELSVDNEVFIVYRINSASVKDFTIERGVYDGLRIFAINNTFNYCDNFLMTYRNKYIGRIFCDILEEVKPDIVHIQHLLFLSVSIIEEIDRRGIPIVLTLHDYWLICPQGQLFDRSGRVCAGYGVNNCYDCQKYQMAIRKGVMPVYSALQRLTHPRLTRALKNIYFLFARLSFLKAENGRSFISERLEYIKSACKKVDFFTAPSRFIRDKFVARGFDGRKIEFVPYGFDCSLFRGFPEVKQEKIAVVFIGTLLPAKGPDLLISAFNKLGAVKAELRIYGRLASYRGFEGYIRSLKALAKGGNIKFIGEFEHRNIGEVLSRADALVVPSRWQENSPLVIQEAQLAGVPVIASNTGGIPELVIHRENGLLFRAGDSNDLFLQLKAFIEEPGLAGRLKRSAKEPVKIEENARVIMGLYEQAISRRARKQV